MNTQPPALVVGAARMPLPFGLFSVLLPREGASDRWEGGGVEFEELGCPPPADTGIIGAYECEGVTPGLPKDFESNGGVGEAGQFTVYQSEKCSPIGNGIDRSNEIARQRLAAFEELLVERELWKLLDRVNLSRTVDLASATVRDDIIEAVAELAQLEATTLGTLGVLHMRRDVAMLAIKAGVVEVRQARLFTTLGTPVIAGSGYGDTGTTQKIVLTPQLFGYRSDVFTSSNRPGDLLDRKNNDLYGVAERNYLVGFDQSCIELAPIPEPDPDPAED